MSHAIPTCIVGAAGRMGRTLIRCLQEGRVEGLRLAAAVDRAGLADTGLDAGVLSGTAPANVPLGDSLEAACAQAEAFIDFSHHSATAQHARILAAHGKALVVGTTGLSPEELAEIEEAARRIPVVMAPNMSLGVNLLCTLVTQAARALKDRGYDVEIVERHHRRKKDSPSGTALGLGQAAAEGLEWDLAEVARHGREGMEPGDRPVKEIGFHAVRGGDFIGDHTVIFAAEGESVELSHRATSRDTFAIGALRAARWAAGRPSGLYSMRDVLGL